MPRIRWFIRPVPPAYWPICMSVQLYLNSWPCISSVLHWYTDVHDVTIFRLNNIQNCVVYNTYIIIYIYIYIYLMNVHNESSSTIHTELLIIYTYITYNIYIYIYVINIAVISTTWNDHTAYWIDKWPWNSYRRVSTPSGANSSALGGPHNMLQWRHTKPKKYTKENSDCMWLPWIAQ